MDVKTQYNSTNIVAAAPTTTLVATGSGVLHSITFNKPVATGTCLFYNGITAATLLGSITTPANPMPVTLIYDIVFAVGLTIVTGTAAQDITISWAQG